MGSVDHVIYGDYIVHRCSFIDCSLASRDTLLTTIKLLQLPSHSHDRLSDGCDGSPQS